MMFKNFLIIFGCLLPTISFAQTNDINTHGYFNFHGGSLPINAKTIIDVDGVDYVIGDLIKQINEGFGNISTLEAAIQQAGLDAQTALNLANQAQTTASNAIPLSQKGIANGVAMLDENKNITNSVIGSVANALANTAGDTVSSIANTAKNAVQTNGGDASKTVVTPTGDTASHSLSDVAAQVTGSVQKTSIGAVNGVAPLDANKMMSAPVSGDISQSPVTSQSLNGDPTGPSLARDVADNAYIHSMGSQNVAADGTVNAASIGKVLATVTRPITLKLSSGEHLPANSAGNISISDSLLNWVMVDADGQLMNSDDEGSSNASWDGGNLSRQVGDGVLVRAFEPKFGIVRDREYNNSSVYDYKTYRSPAPITSDFMTNNAQWNTPLECTSPSQPGYNAYWCNRQNWGVSMHNNTLNTTSNVGAGIINNQMESTGWGYGGAFDVEEMERFRVGGTNWHWVGVSEMDEIDGMTTGGYSLDGGKTVTQSGARNYLEEKDMSGYGPEDPRTSWDPTYSTRIPYWFNSWYPGNAPAWTANTTYNAFQVIVVNNNGTDYMYEATIQGGITGDTIPKFSFNESKATVADGTQKWVFVGKKTFQIGRVFGLGSSDNSIQFGTLMSPGGSTFYNAGLDFSQANYTSDIPVVFRTHANTYFDMSADGTKAGQNNHLLGYGHTGGIGWDTLEYVVNGNSTFHVEDSGNIGVTHTTVSAAGTTVDDATSATGQIIQIANASADNAGIRLTFAGDGDTALIQNYSGHPVKIYPINSGWYFSGALPYYTIQNNSVIYVGSRIGGMTNYTVFFDTSKVQLPSMTKADILAIPSPKEGQKVFDSDDHTEATYRCPTTSTCGWFPVQYGTALSN